jgi:hypothetical protein
MVSHALTMSRRCVETDIRTSQRLSLTGLQGVHYNIAQYHASRARIRPLNGPSRLQTLLRNGCSLPACGEVRFLPASTELRVMIRDRTASF